MKLNLSLSPFYRLDMIELLSNWPESRLSQPFIFGVLGQYKSKLISKNRATNIHNAIQGSNLDTAILRMQVK